MFNAFQLKLFVALPTELVHGEGHHERVVYAELQGLPGSGSR